MPRRGTVVKRDIEPDVKYDRELVARLINRVLRLGLDASRQARTPVRPYREKTYDMGVPNVNLDKALVLAAALEDDEVIEKLARRK